MTIGISPRAVDYVRSRATAVMQATCRIERLGDPVFDINTGTAVPGSRTTIYEGKCRIWEVAGDTITMVGEEEIEAQNTQLSIPWDASPVPKRYDQVLITAHNTDSSLVGKRFEISSSAKAGELRATRRFSVKGNQA